MTLATGQRARCDASPLGQDGESLEGQFDFAPAACGIDIAAHLEVLAHRHGREYVLLLWHISDTHAADVAWRATADALAVHEDAAASRLEQPGNGFEQRRFAGAVGPDDTDDLAGVDREIHALQHFVGGAVADDQAFDAEQAQETCRFRPMYASCTASLRKSSSKLPSARFFPSASTTT